MKVFCPMDINIERRTVEFNDVYVKRNGHIAKIDDVLNTLTVLLYSEKEMIPISNPHVVSYLSSCKLIKPASPGCYTATDKQLCAELSDALSDYMDQLLENF